MQKTNRKNNGEENKSTEKNKRAENNRKKQAPKIGAKNNKLNTENKMKTVTLLASAPSLDRITKMVNQYFYSTSIELHEDSSGVYSLINSKGKIDGCRVIKKKNRFRFEMI